MSLLLRLPLLAALFTANLLLAICPARAEAVTLHLRSQQPVDASATGFHRRTEQQSWAGEATAVIVCDMWDSHHGYRAALRTAELAEPIERFLTAARRQGMTIIHAPSNCM